MWQRKSEILIARPGLDVSARVSIYYYDLRIHRMSIFSLILKEDHSFKQCTHD